MTIRTVVWGENVHDRENEIVRSIYPRGMHSAIADALAADKRPRYLAPSSVSFVSPQGGRAFENKGACLSFVSYLGQRVFANKVTSVSIEL